MNFGNLGFMEILLILVAVLLLFGAKRLPEIGASFGKSIKEFKRGLKTGLEYLLKGYWKKEGGKITYAGRREAGLAKRNEAIRLTYPDGWWIEYEFGAKDYLPSKIIYKRERKDPDSGDAVEVTEEDQLLKFITIDGVTAPWVIDHFINGKQTSRVNYESVQYNPRFPDNIFTKPADIKAIK